MGKQIICIAKNLKSFEVSGRGFELAPAVNIKTWPLNKTLTYALITDPKTVTHHNTIVAINEAIRNWTSRIQLKVVRVNTTDPTKVDVPITFSSTDPLFLKADGSNDSSVLGYGYQGDQEDQGVRGIVLNAAENWGVFDVNFATLVQQTICHEFGHILGLGHNPLPKAVMYYEYNGVITLDEEKGGDVDSILALYPARSLPRRIIDTFNNLITRHSEFSN